MSNSKTITEVELLVEALDDAHRRLHRGALDVHRHAAGFRERLLPKGIEVVGERDIRTVTAELVKAEIECGHGFSLMDGLV